MFTFGRNPFHVSSSSSWTITYLFFILLFANQFLAIHSYVYIQHGQEQNQLGNAPYYALQQLAAKYLTPENLSSYNNYLQSSIEPTVQRRFCCMNPLSGRKRFIRDLTRNKQRSNELHQ